MRPLAAQSQLLDLMQCSIRPFKNRSDGTTRPRLPANPSRSDSCTIMQRVPSRCWEDGNQPLLPGLLPRLCIANDQRSGTSGFGEHRVGYFGLTSLCQSPSSPHSRALFLCYPLQPQMPMCFTHGTIHLLWVEMPLTSVFNSASAQTSSLLACLRVTTKCFDALNFDHLVRSFLRQSNRTTAGNTVMYARSLIHSEPRGTQQTSAHNERS